MDNEITSCEQPESENDLTVEQEVRNMIDERISTSYGWNDWESLRIVKHCLRNDVEDSNLVVEALKSFGTLKAFLITAHCKGGRWYASSGAETATEREKEGLLEYLLKHVVKTKWDFFELLSRNVWSSEQYKKDCIFHEPDDIDPTKTAVFLRHGYVVTTYKKDIPLDEQWSHLYRSNAVFIGKMLLTFRWMLTPLEDEDTESLDEDTESEDEDSESEDIISRKRSFQLYMRSIPFPLAVPSSVELQLCKDMNKKDMQSILRSLFPETIFDLDIPRTLKHLCRCIIRDCLFYNWMLPEGIWQLEVPTCLQSYLNLES